MNAKVLTPLLLVGVVVSLPYIIPERHIPEDPYLACTRYNISISTSYIQKVENLLARITGVSYDAATYGIEEGKVGEMNLLPTPTYTGKATQTHLRFSAGYSGSFSINRSTGQIEDPKQRFTCTGFGRNSMEYLINLSNEDIGPAKF